MDNYFYTAKILTPSSKQTKNQAEVIYVRDGEKRWAIPVASHKASESELKLDKIVLYHGQAWREELVAHRAEKDEEFKTSSTSRDRFLLRV